MREKLIELIIDGFRNCTKPHEVCSQLDLEAFADYLIANGVTIETEPADTVEVVRCNKCKYYGCTQVSYGDGVQHFCRLHKGLVLISKDSFCPYGERREKIK